MAKESPALEPYPSSNDEEGGRIVFHEEDVVRDEVEVREWREAEYALSDDELPAQGLSAVSHDVAVDLGAPEGEVEDGEGVDVRGAQECGPVVDPEG